MSQTVSMHCDASQEPTGGAAFLYLPGSIPWDLMTPIAVGLLRTSISSFAASIDWELALNPW